MYITLSQYINTRVNQNTLNLDSHYSLLLDETEAIKNVFKRLLRISKSHIIKRTSEQVYELCNTTGYLKSVEVLLTTTPVSEP